MRHDAPHDPHQLGRRSDPEAQHLLVSDEPETEEEQATTTSREDIRQQFCVHLHSGSRMTKS